MSQQLLEQRLMFCCIDPVNCTVAAAGPWCAGIQMEALQPGMYTQIKTYTHNWNLCALHRLFSCYISPCPFEREHVSLCVAM